MIRRISPGVFSRVIVAVSDSDDDESWYELPEDTIREWYDRAVMELAGAPEVLH